MNILFIGEYKKGGGAKANLNLAIAASQFAHVAFFGIDYYLSDVKSINFLKNKAKHPISIRYFFYLCAALNHFHPDIVHATGMYTGLLTLLTRTMLHKKYKIILTLHHTSLKFRFNYFVKKLIGILNHVDLVNYISDYQRSRYLSLGLNPENFRIIPYVFYPNFFPATDILILRNKLLHDTSSDFLIIYACRLVENKQVHVFIETIQKINLNGYNAAGIIVGTGGSAYVAKLKDLAHKLNIEKKVILTGFSDKAELYIGACDFSLFPTLHDEAQPFFILETFTQHKTIVVSNHPSIKNIVTNNIDSLVAEEHQPEIYAAKCIQLIEKNEMRQQLEAGAGNTFSLKYNPDKVIKKYKKMYYEQFEKI
jgi:glycosyltransferase involved in cell wall biosynthesis